MRVEDIASRSKQEKSKKLLFDSFKNRTAYYLNKPTLNDTDLYHYIKDFFREYLDMAHEMSFEEIIAEIEKTYIPKNVKEKIINFVVKIKVIEYKDEFFDEDQLKNFIKEFYQIVKSFPEEKKKENSALNKFLIKVGLKKDLESIKPKGKVEIKDESKHQEVSIDLDKDVNIKDEDVVKSEVSTSSNMKKDESQNLDNKKEVANIKEDEGDIPDFDDDSNSSNFDDEHSEKKSFEKKDKVSKYLNNISLDDDFTKEINNLKSGERDDSNWLDDLDEDSFEEVDSSKKSFKSAASNEVSRDKSEIFNLIESSKSVTDKSELVKIYKRVNELYEQKSVAEKAKIYPMLMELYNKISKK